MKKYTLLIFIIICFIRCTNDIWRGIPINEDAPAPPQVTDVQTIAIPGGAKISYTLPKSDNLLYVMAEYSLRNSIIQKKSSYYSNNIILEGFPDTKEYKVKIYSVSRDGTQSSPVDVTITPLTPPVISILNSIIMEPTFGGVKVRFANDNESEVKITVLTTDSLGDLYPADIHYTKRKEGYFSTRGFKAEDRKFGIYILDRWNNYSDTIYTDLTPWFEEELDKFHFKALNLPTDTYEAHLSGATVNKIWDGIWGNAQANILHTKPNTGIPQWFTFDLGVRARLSRFIFHHRLAGNSGANTDGQYSAGDPRVMEIYGSNAPNPDGSWESWTLLGLFESIKPSGQTSGSTTEDIQYATENGEDFEFPDGIQDSYRYLRFKTLKTWGGQTYIYIAELTFWGEVVETN